MARKADKKEPLLAALDAADAAIHGEGSPEDRVARALVSLADGLAEMLATSDTRPRSGIPAQQVLDRFRLSQSERIAEIRSLATEATGSKPARLAGISGRARSATKSAVRSEVKKRRVRRGNEEDSPGGEG